MKETTKMISRDSLNRSPWQAGIDLPVAHNDADHSGLVDVIVVGAGITGITTALILQKAGRKCIVLEAANIGFGTTGGTSAHLNTFFDATYPEIEVISAKMRRNWLQILARKLSRSLKHL